MIYLFVLAWFELKWKKNTSTILFLTAVNQSNAYPNKREKQVSVAIAGL